MVNLISFPFRLSETGAVVVREDGTDDYYAEELAVLLLTKIEERHLVPEYGVTDPAFGSFDPQEFINKVATFGPPVTISEIKRISITDAVENIQVSFDSADETEDYDYEDDEVDVFTDDLEETFDAFA